MIPHIFHQCPKFVAKRTARPSLDRGDIYSTTAYSSRKPVNISMLYCPICQFLDDHVPFHPWYLDLGLRFPILNFTKEVMVIYNLILCNLKLPSYWIITNFELLNEWYGVELDIQKICNLYTIQQSSKCHYLFQARAKPLQSFLRSTKIQSGIKLMAPMSLSCTILSSRLRLHSGSMKLKKKGIRCIEKPKKKNKNKNMLMREVLSLYLRKVDKSTIVGETTPDEVRALIVMMLSV
ncbi:hypothetical protein D8674_013503 [Pyrus ussuriensis x Pyrus communis]|uniref:Uncharacterized protein n=1 Tax=Pyrus ussuriensis x Pyrus communis TaxID=2448454 RepID=A0A5N5H3G0_9ROSA|nr:hypothetical protein D8674_013503 [Pyrus ussuriensis x Pyrus communis]